jgi:hypothetical protein
MEQNEILEKAKLNWTVRCEGVKSESGIIIPKTKCIIRNDTDVPLGIHKDGYDPYQNHELLELLYRIGRSTGLEMHSGGLFGAGEKVWFQLKSGSHTMPNDRSDGFITGINSFDGRTSLAFGNSTKTISCQNTFWFVYREVATKLRHSSNMRPRIEEILVGIDRLIKEEEINFNRIDRLSEVRITPELKEMVTKMLFDIPLHDRFEPKELSTNKQNKIIRYQADYMTETNQKGDNLWGLFSSVTRYTTHSMLLNGVDNTQSKIIGSAGNHERKIWNALVPFIE